MVVVGVPTQSGGRIKKYECDAQSFLLLELAWVAKQQWPGRGLVAGRLAHLIGFVQGESLP
jgi:hypothetical protein